MKILLGLLLVMVLAIGGSIYNKRQHAQLAAKEVAEAAARSAREDANRKSAIEAKGKAAVLEQLTDPESANFRDIKVYAGVDYFGTPNVDVVCGQVNSKNRMGGYVGFHPFRWTSHDGKLLITDGGFAAAELDKYAIATCAHLQEKAN